MHSFSFSLRQVFHIYKRIYAENVKTNEQGVPAVIEELNGEADDFVICDNSFVLVGHLSPVLIRSIRGFL